MATRDTNNNFKLKATVIIILLLLGIILFVFFFFGISSIMRFLLIIMEILAGCALLIGLAYLFYVLFIQKQKFDPTYVNKKKMIEAATRLKRPFLKDLFVSGDMGHSRALVGQIKGYLRIQTLLRNYLYNEVTDPKTGNITKNLRMKTNEQGVLVPEYLLEKQEQDVFVVKPKGWISGLFGKEMVIRCNPEDHDSLVGDVTLYGFSLIPISEYWFLNTDHLDVRKIDFAILKEAERTVAFATLSDMKEIVDLATGINAVHKRNIEQKSLVELPETQQIGQTSRYE